MANFEKLLQRAMYNDTTLGLPWWDWWPQRFERQGIPAVYKDEFADGQPNPLYKYRMNFTGVRSGTINRDTKRLEGQDLSIADIRTAAVYKEELMFPICIKRPVWSHLVKGSEVYGIIGHMVMSEEIWGRQF